MGSFSSRGALIGFAVAPVTPALVMLAGDQAASAALVTCVSLAPCATEGPLSCLGRDCCRSWVLWRWQHFPWMVGRGFASAMLGKGQLEGRRRSVLGMVEGFLHPGHSFYPSTSRGWWAAQGDSGDFLCPCLLMAQSQIRGHLENRSTEQI